MSLLFIIMLGPLLTIIAATAEEKAALHLRFVFFEGELAVLLMNFDVDHLS